MLANRLGRPLRFILTPGQAGDVIQAPALLRGYRAAYVIADTAYDSRALARSSSTSALSPSFLQTLPASIPLPTTG